MFLGSTKPELQAGVLRSGRIFRLGKRRKTEETPRSGHDYITPGVSPEVRSRASSPERVVNIDSASTATSAQEGTPTLNYSSNKHDANSMDGHDIWLPTFNGNGAEDPK